MTRIERSRLLDKIEGLISLEVEKEELALQGVQGLEALVAVAHQVGLRRAKMVILTHEPAETEADE